MKEETQVELLKIAAQMTQMIMTGKSNASIAAIDEAQKSDDAKRSDCRAVFDYWLAHLKKSIT